MDPSVRIDRSPPIPGPYSGSPQGSPNGGNAYGGSGGGMRGRGMSMSRLGAMSPDTVPQVPQQVGPMEYQRAPGMSGMLASRGTRRMQGYTMPPRPTDMHGVTPGRAQELPGPDYMQAQRQRLAAALGPQNAALAGYMGG